MKRGGLVLAALVVIASALPGAAADDAPVEATVVTMAGNLDVEALLEALFLPAGNRGMGWEATAASVVLERTYSNVTSVADTGFELVGDGPDDVTRTEVYAFHDARLGATDSRERASLLVDALGEPLSATGRATGFLDATIAEDPLVSSKDERDVEGGRSSVNYGVETQLSGIFVNLTGGRATYELRGTLVLQLYDVDYEVQAGGSTSDFRTGHYSVNAAGPLERSRVESHRLTLTDAVLVVEVPSSVSLFATEPRVILDGSVRVESGGSDAPLGPLRFAGADAEGASEWRGRATLDLRASAGLVSVAPLSTQGGLATPISGPASSLLAAAGILAVALVLGAVVAVARRRPRAGSVEAALLAMEERRWEDALDELERVLAAQPAPEPILLLDRAICHEELGRLDAARADYEAVLVETPGSAEAHYYYSRLLARLRMSTACLAHLSRALALDERLVELARKEAAFDAFRDHPQFLAYLRS